MARTLGIDIPRTKICGGGAKSLLWRKIIANVLGISLDIIESEEGPGYGGAMLAAVACGDFKSVAEAADSLVKVTESMNPEPGLMEKYADRYHAFKQIYPALKPVFRQCS